MEERYIVIMGDLINSQQVSDIAALHQSFNTAVNTVNADLSEILASPLTITLGDEFQGLSRDLQGGLLVMQRMRWRLLAQNLSCRFVLGSVGLATPLNPERAWNMMGPGLARARALVERKRDPNAYRFSLPNHPVIETLMTGLGLALTDIELGWTPRQQQIVIASLADPTPVTAVVEQFKITESVFYKVRRSAKFDLYRTLWSTMQDAANKLGEL